MFVYFVYEKKPALQDFFEKLYNKTCASRILYNKDIFVSSMNIVTHN